MSSDNPIARNSSGGSGHSAGARRARPHLQRHLFGQSATFDSGEDMENRESGSGNTPSSRSPRRSHAHPSPFDGGWKPPAPQEGLVDTWLLDDQGGGTRLDWEGIRAWSPEQGVLWVHLDYSHRAARRWLEREAGVPDPARNFLVHEESRPRVLPLERGLLVGLRGVNNNPEAAPEDMVSLRLWCEERRIITTRRRTLLSLSDLMRALEEREGPRDAGELLTFLADRIEERMAALVSDLEERIADIEELVVSGLLEQARAPLAEARRQSTTLRRFAAPQREAFSRLPTERATWLLPEQRERLRETAERWTRLAEDLELARERSVIAQEEMQARQADRLNRRMYLLPLSFLASLFGANLGGIPGAQSPVGFPIFATLLLMLSGTGILLFRWRRWI